MININNVSFAYKNRPVFEGIDLSLDPGRIYGLFGLNGVGKSTLLRMLTGLLYPQDGQVRILGYDTGLRPPTLLSRIYMLSESPWLPDITDMQFVSRYAPLYPDFNLNTMTRLLSELEIPRGRKLRTLSLGEQKKFHLAFGVACQPSVLLLDEPTNGLDIPSKGLFRRLVAETQSDDRILIVASHQVNDLQQLIDHVLILHHGKFICDQSVSDISEKFRFSQEPVRPDLERADLLYAEPHPAGFATVRADAGAQDGHVDLELLFKAAIANPDSFTRSDFEE